MEENNILKMGLRPLSTAHRSLIDALLKQGFKPPENYPNDAKAARIWLYEMLRITDIEDPEEWMIRQASYSPPDLQNPNNAIPNTPYKKPGYMLLRQFSSMRQRQRQLLNRILGRSSSYHSR
jgi:hypothetical protein